MVSAVYDHMGDNIDVQFYRRIIIDILLIEMGTKQLDCHYHQVIGGGSVYPKTDSQGQFRDHYGISRLELNY